MGYQKSLNAVKRVQSFLDKMAISNDTITFVVEGDSEKIAGLIRQGISAAMRHNLSQYKHLLTKFVVRARRGKVIAELRENAIQPIYTEVRQLVMSEPASIEMVLTTLIKNDLPASVQFTNFSHEDDSEWNSLLEWLKVNDYTYDLSDRCLTLTKGGERSGFQNIKISQDSNLESRRISS